MFSDPHTGTQITTLTATGSTADVITPNSKAAAGIHSTLSMPVAPTPYTQAPTARALNKVPCGGVRMCMHGDDGGWYKSKHTLGVRSPMV